jgi:FtsH-binding integral membrane protein
MSEYDVSRGSSWETGGERSVAQERLAYVRKVYSLFFAAMLVCAGGVYLSYANPFLFAKALWPIRIGTLILLLVLTFSKTARRTKPWNLLLLFGFNFMIGLTAGPLFFMIEAAGKGAVLLQAFIMTSGIFGGLTAYAWLSKKDFSFLGGFLTVGIIGLLLATIVYMFIPGATGLGFAIACVGVLIMAGFVLYDTSNILHRYHPDEYVAGALDLFIDFYMMFWYIVQIFMGSSRD